jgi:hypothetical protein
MSAEIVCSVVLTSHLSSPVLIAELDALLQCLELFFDFSALV